MSLFTTTRRMFSNTAKQIKRSGWLATGSTLVMTLAFFIGIVFLLLAYASNLFLQSIESSPHIFVFFYPGTSEEEMFALRDRLMQMPEVYNVEYTNETQAMEEFQDVQERKDPELAESIRENILPPDLGIRLNKINDADKIIDLMNVEKTNNKNILAIGYVKETIDTFKNLFNWLRIGGGIIIGILLIVIFLFTLLTVEFRTYNRAEEISIMQLVGGSLWFIRAPFILEGAFYGFVGSLISSGIIFGLGYIIFGINKATAEVTYITNLFAGLNWPALTPVHYVAGFFGILIIGTLVGAFNSLIAIRRYIY